MRMHTSEVGLDLLKRLESFSEMSYPDGNGRSIGYGHFIKEGEHFDEPITEERAEEELTKDVAWAEKIINLRVKVPLTQSMFDALVSFVYNVGSGAFSSSTLLKILNEEEYQAIPAQMKRWIYYKSKVNPGLIKRRHQEAMLFKREEL